MSSRQKTWPGAATPGTSWYAGVFHAAASLCLTTGPARLSEACFRHLCNSHHPSQSQEVSARCIRPIHTAYTCVSGDISLHVQVQNLNCLTTDDLQFSNRILLLS